MKTIVVERPFRHSDDGNHITEYGAGEQTVSDRCALVAVEHLKVATYKGEDKKPAKAKGKA